MGGPAVYDLTTIPSSFSHRLVALSVSQVPLSRTQLVGNETVLGTRAPFAFTVASEATTAKRNAKAGKTNLTFFMILIV